MGQITGGPRVAALAVLVALLSACAGDDARTSSATGGFTSAGLSGATAASTTSGESEGGSGESDGGSGATSGESDGGATTGATTAASLSTSDGTSAGSTSDATSAGTTSAGTTSAGTTSDGTSEGTTADGSTSDDITTGPDPLACPPALPLECEPGPGSGEADTCFDGAGCFLKTVQDAVKSVLNDHPEWFDYGDGQPFVLEVELYMNTVVEVVSSQELCAIRDPNAGDEIAVKHDNGYAESFDILTADGHARYGDLIYTATCAPAWF